ncbi:MAG: sensor histidine kinase [Lachnospiraceae bacterium]
MHTFHFLSKLRHSVNSCITRQLRRVGIFWRLNLSFLLLLLISSLFLTFFSFHQYSTEINLNLDRYVSLLVQNVQLKVDDTMSAYEDIALCFYDDADVLAAVSENARIGRPENESEAEQVEKNTYIIEHQLYTLSQSRRYIENVQFVTPDRQYRMVEENGFARSGLIRDLDSFYHSDFYLLPQKQNGYPVWMDDISQTHTFFRNDQSVYGIGNIITLGVAVYEPAARNFLGVLLFNIDLNAFSNSIEGYDAYKDGNTFLIGKDGVLTWFDPSLSAPSFPETPELYAHMLETKSGILRTDMNRRNLLLAYQQIPGSQIFATYIADLDVLLANAYHIRDLCILVLVCVVIATFVLSHYVTRSISVPIRSLVRVMSKTADGRWTVRYENSGNDEITTLGDQFNDMAEKTNQLIEQVYLSEIKRQRAQLSWKNAQLDAMLMQINPHFLYNTLDIIRWEAMYEANGESPVTQMIEKFSRLCRMGMKTNSNTIPLSEGIEHAVTYLDVINFRHSDKIQLDLNTQAGTESLYIPQFMLQPLMENAVTHAFGDASRGCRIMLCSHLNGDRLLITLEDNGRGMTPEELDALNSSLGNEDSSDKGIGIRNVHQRIRLFYGDSYGLHITSIPGEGTTITITLPIRTISENMTNLQPENMTNVQEVE